MLTDAQWAVLEPLIEECRPQGKTPPQDLRRTIEAIIWRHENGAKWRAVPAELGPWWRAAQTFIRWARLGVWERLLELVQERGDPARDDVPRRHQRAGAPEGGRGAPKRGSQAQRDAREALGRSRGGYGTKACVIADGLGRAIAFRPRARSGARTAARLPLLESLPRVPSWVVATAATPATAFASTSGASGARRRSRPSATRRRSPVRTGSTTTATSSSASGPGSRSGAPSQPATRRPPDPSWACSASPPLSTGSSANRP